jgi:hypothetical protein
MLCGMRHALQLQLQQADSPAAGPDANLEAALLVEYCLIDRSILMNDICLEHPLRAAASDKLEAAELPACCSPASFAPSKSFRAPFCVAFSIIDALDLAPLLMT